MCPAGLASSHLTQVRNPPYIKELRRNKSVQATQRQANVPPKETSTSTKLVLPPGENIWLRTKDATLTK